MSEARNIRFMLNGRAVSVAIEPHRNLVELLHDQGLFGARESCGQGLCGCCTVLVDDVAVSGCLYLAVAVDGKNIVTVEHLDSDGALSAVQQAFIDAGAFQCGFCTPGFVMACKAFIEKHHNPTAEQVKEALGGNLCRCGTYLGVRKVVVEAAMKMKGGHA